MENLKQYSGALYNEALKKIKNNNVYEASILLKKGLDIYREDIDTLNLIGLCQFISCDFNSANYYWQLSNNLSSENNIASEYVNYLNSNEFNEVLEKYNQSIKALKNKEYLKCIDFLKNVIERNEDLIEPYVIIGLCYCKLKQYNSAEKYMGKAIERDRLNNRFLSYMNSINKLKSELVKRKNNKSNNILKIQILVISICVIAIIVMVLVFYRENNKILEKYNNSIVELQNVRQQLEESKEFVIEEKIELEGNESVEGYTPVFSGIAENIVFNEAIAFFNTREYEEALIGFSEIINVGINENLVAESLFFAAVSKENTGEYIEAEQYYNEYYQKYSNRCYGDDSLYNCGLMLYKQGQKELAKEKLNTLVEMFPNSIFNNSNVKYILTNE